MFSTDAGWKSLVHPQNKRRINPVYFYKPDENHRGYRSDHYPDFYDAEHQVVLDAKYKADVGIARDDLLQMIAYVHILEYRAGVFLKPDGDSTGYRKEGTLATGKGESIGVATLKIVKFGGDDRFGEFVVAMQNEERKMVTQLQSCFHVICEGISNV